MIYCMDAGKSVHLNHAPLIRSIVLTSDLTISYVIHIAICHMSYVLFICTSEVKKNAQDKLDTEKD